MMEVEMFLVRHRVAILVAIVILFTYALVVVIGPFTLSMGGSIQ